ncbi:MAG: hypothetical protein JXA42_26335 [Anaerolineales bacterium]|nr:hypothetical protein [Anaerolineales bacterium]
MDDIDLTNNDRFYLIKIGDLDGSTAHGPYSEETAIANQGKDERVISQTRLERMREPQPLSKPVKQPLDPGLIHEKMIADTRQWGRALLFLGVIHMIASGFLNSTWGIILVLVGLLSFLFQTSSMFVIYGIVLAWAAINNGLSGEIGWILFAIFQMFLAVQVFRTFSRYRRAEAQVNELVDDTIQTHGKKRLTAAFIFPWSGCIIGLLSLVVLVGSIAAIFVMEAAGTRSISVSTLDLTLGLSMELGVFAFALGLASLLSRYRYKLASIGGIVVGILTILILVGLLLLG